MNFFNNNKMKTGKHYFRLLTEEEQRNFRQACEEQEEIFEDVINKEYEDFMLFINKSFKWKHTQQGREYWDKISKSNRPKQPLATFRLTLIYLAIVYGCLGLLWLVSYASYQQGYDNGYQHGIEIVDSIVNYEELTPESVEAVQELQLNTMRDESK